MAKSKRGAPRLGKGLSSLIGQPVEIAPTAPPSAPAPTETPATSPATPAAQVTSSTPPAAAPDSAPVPAAAEAPTDTPDGLRHLAVTAITPNPDQPRQHFAQDALDALAQSIATAGLMQPIVVRPMPGSDASEQFELVAGERRWRAAQIAGLEQIPAIVRELDDQTVAEWALIENLQREDLNPIERALAFERLRTHFGLSHEAIADHVGINRATVTNSLRLLGLHDSVRDLVANDLISNGQAKVLAGINDETLQLKLAERAVRESLSVRQLETLSRAAGSAVQAAATGDPSTATIRSTHLADIERQITAQLGTKVKLRPGRRKGTGTLSIDFHSNESFEALLDKLGVTLDG